MLEEQKLKNMMNHYFKTGKTDEANKIKDKFRNKTASSATQSDGKFNEFD